MVDAKRFQVPLEEERDRKVALLKALLGDITSVNAARQDSNTSLVANDVRSGERAHLKHPAVDDTGRAGKAITAATSPPHRPTQLRTRRSFGNSTSNPYGRRVNATRADQPDHL